MRFPLYYGLRDHRVANRSHSVGELSGGMASYTMLLVELKVAPHGRMVFEFKLTRPVAQLSVSCR